jgi:hypothetical protein
MCRRTNKVIVPGPMSRRAGEEAAAGRTARSRRRSRGRHAASTRHDGEVTATRPPGGGHHCPRRPCGPVTFSRCRCRALMAGPLDAQSSPVGRGSPSSDRRSTCHFRAAPSARSVPPVPGTDAPLTLGILTRRLARFPTVTSASSSSPPSTAAFVLSNCSFPAVLRACLLLATARTCCSSPLRCSLPIAWLTALG